ncbi:hypothetical protein [Microbacterium aurantiacum]|uniref:Uncharacterized protein n=1 Tax=Microbacterium aurantiacum TaxID=162393 RepID=A0AAJ2HGT0_9MICO|nr:hypothetical protein [Microbacterium aurantiacum]MDS0244205.1 hypothetical protein [Microbacterium aurantiacum]
MGRAVTRRTLISGSLAAMTGSVIAACSPAAPEPTSSPSATPSPSPTPTGNGAAPPAPTSARPATVRSYGPNGTHFPADLPWPGEQAPTELVVDCDWEEIAESVESLSAADVARGVVVRVLPGTLGGNGSGSSSTPVLSALGDPSWERNLLIVPRDGFGSVSIAGEGTRMDGCARLSLFGFVGTGGFTLTECTAMQIGWSRFSALSVTRGGSDLAFYELILGFRQDPEDTVGIRPTEDFEMTNISRFGCVFGPSVKPEGSDAHCDTIQLEGTGSGAFGPLASVDCVDYGSSNAAELVSGQLSQATYEHCLILAGFLPWEVYPLRPGDYRGEPNAFSGGCQDVQLTDSWVSGAIGRVGFTRVENTTLSYAPVSSQQPRDAGTWDVDPGMAQWSRAQIMDLQSVADYEISTLRGVWGW